jgi:hypothetical protein
LLYRLPEPDLQGRTAIVLSPLELLERLARLIPPPRVHRHRYHGLLVPHTRLRAIVVAIGRAGLGVSQSGGEPHGESAPAAEPATPLAVRPVSDPEGGLPRASRIAGALLLARIYEVLPLLCPACGGERRVLAFLTDPPTVRAVLVHLGLPDRPPPLSPARGPPQAEIDLGQTPDFDPAQGDPGPDFDFDQPAPDDGDD